MTDTIELLLCDDCVIAIVNYDFTGMTESRTRVVQLGLRRLAERGITHVVPIGGTREFRSVTECACCGTVMAADFTTAVAALHERPTA